MYSCLSGGGLFSLWLKLLQYDDVPVYQPFCYFFVFYQSSSTELNGYSSEPVRLKWSRLAGESCNHLKALFGILWRSHDDFSGHVLKAPWIKCRLHDPMSMGGESLFFWHLFCISESNFKLVFWSIHWDLNHICFLRFIWNVHYEMLQVGHHIEYDQQTKMSVPHSDLVFTLIPISYMIVHFTFLYAFTRCIRLT